MPRWVQEGVEEYRKRIENDLGFSVIEIPLARRTNSQNIEQCIKKEGSALIARLQQGDFVVAFEVTGKVLDTPALARRIDQLRLEGRNLSLLVGGPDGLSQDCLDRADEIWSLSALTIPHPLVRILLTEQLYRASSILKDHPYHRG